MNICDNQSRRRIQKSSLTQFALAIVFVSFFLPSLIPAVAEESSNEFTLPWESRPYRVQVWICNERSPELQSVIPKLSDQISRRARILDPSGWNVTIQTGPEPWRSILMESLEDTSQLDELASSEAAAEFDKLVAVCLVHYNGTIRYQVREFDVQTGQWGALLERRCAQGRDLASGLISAIQRVFMPLARIDRVNDDGQVFVRARAINTCQTADAFDENAQPRPIVNSPVWVRPEDRFLPVIRKVDRNGDLAELEPIPFTYLTVDSLEGPRLVCKLHSRQRSVLGGRSSKRAQKLALVIRPPESSTKLKLVSRDDDKRPLSGYEIFSRSPNATSDQDSTFLGLTDWRGIVEIPPFDEGLRLIYVKRGSRALMKLPIIPGLYDELETAVPDDEARLNAEGITNGFQIEILNLVAQRELLQAQIQSWIKDGQLEQARTSLQQFQRLETGPDLKIRLADEETRLKNSTLNQRELDRISRMFQQLNTLVNKNVSSSVESELQAAIQKAR